MKEKLILVGGGHLAKEIENFIQRYDLYDIVGFTVNKENMASESYLGFPVYPLEELEEYAKPDEVKLFVAVSWYNYFNKYKEKLFNELKGRGYHFANLIAPDVEIGSTVRIGEGNWISRLVLLGYNASIGSNNVILGRSTIGHYSEIGNHNFISAHVLMNGHVKVQNRTFILGGANIVNRVKVGSKCVIGAGTVVKKDLKDYSIVISPRCKVIPGNEEMVESLFQPFEKS